MPTLICRNEQDERAALETLARVRSDLRNQTASEPYWIGYNNQSFDGPVLETRARLLGLPPFYMDLRKYGSRNVCDLYAELTFNGSDGCAVMSRSLKAMAARFGIANSDGFSGDQVAELVRAGQYEDVAAHCQADIDTTLALFTRLHPRWHGLVIDLETASIDGVEQYRQYVKPDGRLTDPAKQAADIEKKLEKAPLDPYLCRIVCVGYEVVGVDLPVLPVPAEVEF
jgi:DNA polymerase III epsilon subunit-like protein